MSANLLLCSPRRVAPYPAMAPLSVWASLACCKDSYMRPEGSQQLNASSWQYWLHPESHGTRGFNTEPRCSSPEGITGAVLREMDPRHSYDQGCPASTHWEYTLTITCANTHCAHTEEHGILSFTFTQLYGITRPSSTHPCSLSRPCTHKQQHTTYDVVLMLHMHCIFLVHCPVTSCIPSPFICYPISIFKPLRTIITVSHSVTRRIQSPVQSIAIQCS